MFREAMAAAGGEPPTLEQQRAAMAMLSASATELQDVTVTEAYAGGCRAYWHDPAGCATWTGHHVCPWRWLWWLTEDA